MSKLMLLKIYSVQMIPAISIIALLPICSIRGDSWNSYQQTPGHL